MANAPRYFLNLFSIFAETFTSPWLTEILLILLSLVLVRLVLNWFKYL